MACRADTHAGSWYSDRAPVLRGQLERWLSEARTETHNGARAIIAPHAGYDYSGSTAAYAYKQLEHNKRNIKRIFILGPSHHYHLSICELTACATYRTPLTNLTIDKEVITTLKSTREFGDMRRDVDEAEHSIELQLPYIAQAMAGQSFTVVPILVGSLNLDKQAAFGAVLAPYLQNPENFFVISSDFCHWGQRFNYTFYDKKQGEIWQSIEALDKLGMAAIESQDPQRFHTYQSEYRNTICGRFPISVLLQALQCCETRFHLKFLHYAQSSKCSRAQDSSVSYAAAVLVPRQPNDSIQH